MTETTQAEVAPFTKSLRVGQTPDGHLFLAIEWNGTKLSITGVEGPKANGDVRGDCGQCIDALKRLRTYGPDWSQHRAHRLAELWERWHLNDMRACCEHQRAAGWLDLARNKVKLAPLRRSAALYKRSRQAERGTMTTEEYEAYREVAREVDALTIGSFKAPTPKHADLYGELGARLLADGHVEIDKRQCEVKTCGWVHPCEHPDGLLTKKCEECGHSYGSARLTEPVPADVLAELRELPDADLPNPWDSC